MEKWAQVELTLENGNVISLKDVDEDIFYPEGKRFISKNCDIAK